MRLASTDFSPMGAFVFLTAVLSTRFLKPGGKSFGKGNLRLDRGVMVTYGSFAGGRESCFTTGDTGEHGGSQNPHPVSQKTRDQDGAPTRGRAYAEAAWGDGGGGVCGEGGQPGVVRVEAVGGEFAVRPDCR